MTFGRAWILLISWLPLAWALVEWRRAPKRAGLVLKALAFFCLLLALAEPRLTVSSTKMAVAVLVDTSASVSETDLARASELASRIEGARGRHWTRVIPFSRLTRQAGAAEMAKSWKLQHTAGEAGRGTDLEAAVREGIAALPAGMVPRLVLISDGKENFGSVARAAWQARQLGIPIDTFVLAGRPKPELRLESAALPPTVFSGERFPVELAIHSPRRTSAIVETAAEGKMLGTSPVTLEAGVNRVTVTVSLGAAGAVELSGAVRAQGLGEVRFAQALSVRRPRLLLLSMDPPDAGQHLLQTLSAGQFEVTRAEAEVPADLSRYELLVFSNWDLESISDARKQDLEKFVREGGGLLVIGGERNVYVEKKNKSEDPLDRTLPATLSPPRSPEGVCVVLIVDKSSSMEGRKIELARLAAAGVVENLRPIDKVGVLIFDNSFHWTIPIRWAEDRSLIKRLIAGIMPDGGTQIAPALAEAYRKTLSERALYKHIVLLTDGISEEGDSITLAQEAARNRVTISTVGLGQDVNRAFLEKVATFSRGRAYFLTDPSGLEQVLLKDVMEHTGSTAVEKPFQPIVLKHAEILKDTSMDSAPPLRGYVRFDAKPTAETILSVDRKDPLLVRWQYGLGRAAVFTSDAKSRWATDWVAWKGFDRFWINLMRDLLPHAQTGEATPSYDSATDTLIVDYRLAPQVEEPKTPPDLFVMGPQSFHRPLALTKVADGAYRGRAPIGGAQGLFRIRPLAESRAFPEIGFYRQEQELSEYGSEEEVLRRVAEFTGGRFQPAAAQVFDTAGRSVPSTMRLWPGLLALVILLNLAELVIRKWKGILDALRSSQ